MVMNSLKGSFRPEFLNRLDEIIMFKPLTKDNIANIIDLVIADINKRIADKEMTITLSEKAKDYIAESAYDPVYGARPLKRYIQKNIETSLAKEILAGRAGQGDNLTVDVSDGTFIIK